MNDLPDRPGQSDLSRKGDQSQPGQSSNLPPERGQDRGRSRRFGVKLKRRRDDERSLRAIRKLIVLTALATNTCYLVGEALVFGIDRCQ